MPPISRVILAMLAVSRTVRSWLVALKVLISSCISGSNRELVLIVWWISANGDSRRIWDISVDAGRQVELHPCGVA